MGNKRFNKFYWENGYCIGITTDGIKFLIDSDDYNKVSRYTWRSKHGKGISTTVRKKTLMLSKLILENSAKKVLHRNGNSLDFRKSNLWTGNIYERFPSHIEIECFDGKKIIISPEDLDIVAPYVWHVDKNGYAITKKDGKMYKMHRIIMGLSTCNTLEVDHINRNTIDNRRTNLRIATRSQNCINRGLLSSNKSGTAGVYWASSVGKWAAQISNNGVKHYLGVFDSLEDAVLARQSQESVLHKQFSPPLTSQNRQSASKTRKE